MSHHRRDPGNLGLREDGLTNKAFAVGDPRDTALTERKKPAASQKARLQIQFRLISERAEKHDRRKIHSCRWLNGWLESNRFFCIRADADAAAATPHLRVPPERGKEPRKKSGPFYSKTKCWQSLKLSRLEN